MENHKTCDGCVHDGDGLDISGSTCYLCMRNPVDHRIDWFKEIRNDNKYKKGDLIKTLVRKLDFGGKYIKVGTKGYVMDSWKDEYSGDNMYAINFGNIWSVAYNENELELFERR